MPRPPHAVVTAVMRAEAEAVSQAAARASADALDRAVGLLAGCPTKAVVSGVGKSGIVGRKTAATLTSTGTPAVFLHPADASHGDLGLLQPGDVGLLISHGGETEELLALLPHFRSRGSKTIGLIGSPGSSLARAVDVFLDTGVDREACPHNLAPTASTAAALALGDGLAMAAMESRGFTPEDFARNHPAGRLGKRLTLRVRDLMHAGVDNPAVGPSASWPEVLAVLCRRSLGGVNVTDPAGRLLGLVTDGDVRRTVQKCVPEELAALTADRMMTRNPVTIGPDRLAVDALRAMEERKSQISVLPVVDGSDGTSLGLLRLHDLLRSGVL